MRRYVPASGLDYPRFEGISTFMRLPHVTELSDVDVAILGIPFDTGASYRVGARFGPQAVRAGSRLLRPYNPSQRINVFKHLSVVDFGDLPVVPGFTDESFIKIEEGLRPIHDAGVTPIAIGGDHSIVLPELRAAHSQYGPLGLVHFDSHGDTWDTYWGQKYTHGTSFRRAIEEGLIDPARSIQIGMRGSLYEQADLDEGRDLGLAIFPHGEMVALGPREIGRLVRERVGDTPTFLSFNIDFIDPASAPGTGTPEVGGLATSDVLTLVRELTGIYIVAADVVEVLPQYDIAELTAMTAANIIFEFLSLFALRKAMEPARVERMIRRQ